MHHDDPAVRPGRRGRVWLAALALVLSPAAADAALILEVVGPPGPVAAGTPVDFTVFLRSTDATDPDTDITTFNLKLSVSGVSGAEFAAGARPALANYLFGDNTDATTFTANPLGNPAVSIVLADVSQHDQGGGLVFDTLPGGESRQLALLTVSTPAGPGGSLQVAFDLDSGDTFLSAPDDSIIPDVGTAGAGVRVLPSAAVPAPPAAALLAVGAVLFPLARRWGPRR
ncbi:MAG: hypothetical protein K2X82_27000 [Gemmataceae bacterium]|nr:hypothetical protein [Gemmataceae bacterium]